ncbi:glycosyltransferase [Granulicella sibirica]|uniref:TPR/glycosyl transferase domain protein n=1 Tax=Granulicella sibirica TaxID=2479048 RepID=A0A4Q0SVY9_9BACT|nr:glycosyltransferase [Granulicella sibirica]RXH54582.1 TPR/glycosyl transferase domain protein [Granulicella sibirica]
MRVLLITYSFPPAAGVGVLRALSLAKYLPANGIQVDVLTARNAAAVGHDPKLLTQLDPDIYIHRTWALDLPFALRKAIKKAVNRRSANTKAAAPSLPKKIAKPNPIKALIGNLLLPDPQIGWLPFAFPAARRIIRSRKIDLVLITVPPFSSATLVTRLRHSFPDLPIVLDFRDEWLTTTIDLVSFNNNARARAVAHKAESEAIRDASAIVCVTHAAVAEVKKRYPSEPSCKFHCIPNGYDTPPPTAKAPTIPQHSTVLTYIGTVYNSTDPTPVVEAILALPPDQRERLKLRFIGYIETPAFRETLLRLGPQVELLGFMPQAEALRHIQTTTYLLLITHDPINVAAKLFDYLGSARPILAAVHPTGDVRRILDDTGAGWSAPVNDPCALGTLFTEAIARTQNLAKAYHPDLAKIAAYHRAPLAGQYATLLRSLRKLGA